ncbi:MAG: SEC-C metal-binding domain-containing protein, partial [Candidatus Dojkabacteria bacterium]|nr:SEC-C metal-binding domain-containing protein [Candidatus Dojkabacteria bacterium]
KRRNLITKFDSLNNNPNNINNLVNANSDVSYISSALSIINDIVESFAVSYVNNVLEDNVDKMNIKSLEKVVQEIINLIPKNILISILQNANHEDLYKYLLNKLQELKSIEVIKDLLYEIVFKSICKQFELLGPSSFNVFKMITLNIFDKLWVEHLEIMHDIRQGIMLQQYAQKDPLIEYKNQAFIVFSSFIRQVNNQVVKDFFKVTLSSSASTLTNEIDINALRTNTEEIDDISTGDREFLIDNISHNLSLSDNSKNINYDYDKSHIPIPAKRLVDRLLEQKISNRLIVQKENKRVSDVGVVYKNVGRNDPCPCGSGKKFKKCHGAINT